MIGELVVVAYLLIALIFGVKIFTKTLSWLAETDRAVFPLSNLSIVGWGVVAFVTAFLLELAVMYPLWGSSAMFLALALFVGPIEEGAKLLPFVFSRGKDRMTRWRLTLKVALFFGIIEALMYFVVLASRGNILGGFLRLIILMFHVAWTAVALESALQGSLLEGYLRASLLHGLYDAPVLLMPFGGEIAGLLALGGIWAIIKLYNSIDEAFRFAVDYEKRLLERRRATVGTIYSDSGTPQNEPEEESGEEILEESGEDFTSWP
ncbi:PrsW family glutamic-type intramembrane protease [Thermococcus sp.]|uniref:PrsW family glutamic-type intramembrane protease n=1 Tax=Thermococcus sp. TaxID=35749 RepID=UPI00263424F3|nr:PrsW family glutamic-type intramembrane protease [Thermococcus sp.]